MVILSYRNAINQGKVLVDCNGIGIRNVERGKSIEEIDQLIVTLRNTQVTGTGGKRVVNENQRRKDATVAQCLIIRNKDRKRQRDSELEPIIQPTLTKLRESMKEEQIVPADTGRIDQPQFFTQPTDTFQILGVQAEPISTIGSSSIEPTGALFLKMEQTRFPAVSSTFQGVNGQVTFNLVVDPRVIGSGKNFIFRHIVHNLTGTDQIKKENSFTITPDRQTVKQSYIIGIPQGAERIRVELQAFTDNGFPASNVFNETFIKQDTTPPLSPPTKTCQCIDPVTGVIKVTSGHPANEPCPVCKLPPPPPIDLAPNIFDKGIVALLAVAALMPRGKKK